jgi:hypothetical protein
MKVSCPWCNKEEFTVPETEGEYQYTCTKTAHAGWDLIRGWKKPYVNISVTRSGGQWRVRAKTTTWRKQG